MTRPMGPERLACWREANHRIVDEFRGCHPRPWFHLPEAAFLAQVAALEADLPGLSERQVLLRWKLIFAAVGDEHTELKDEVLFHGGWPLQVRLTSVGLFIQAAPTGQRDLLGGRIVRVGSMPTEGFLDVVAPLIGAATPGGRALLLEDIFPYTWGWLQELGRLPVGACAEITVARADGTMVTVPMSGAEPQRLALSAARMAQPAEFEPGKRCTFRFLGDGRTLYIRYRSCADDPGKETLKALLVRMDEICRTAPPSRVVVDLRGNLGGWSRHPLPLLRWIEGAVFTKGPGRLYVLTDHRTFSSAMIFAHDLKQHGARLCGTDPGQAMNFYASLRYRRLNGLSVAFQCSHDATCLAPDDKDAWTRMLAVDVPIEATAEDFLGHADGPLEAALAGR